MSRKRSIRLGFSKLPLRRRLRFFLFAIFIFILTGLISRVASQSFDSDISSVPFKFDSKSTPNPSMVYPFLADTISHIPILFDPPLSIASVPGVICSYNSRWSLGQHTAFKFQVIHQPSINRSFWLPIKFACLSSALQLTISTVRLLPCGVCVGSRSPLSAAGRWGLSRVSCQPAVSRHFHAANSYLFTTVCEGLKSWYVGLLPLTNMLTARRQPLQ